MLQQSHRHPFPCHHPSLQPHRQPRPPQPPGTRTKPNGAVTQPRAKIIKLKWSASVCPAALALSHTTASVSKLARLVDWGSPLPAAEEGEWRGNEWRGHQPARHALVTQALLSWPFGKVHARHLHPARQEAFSARLAALLPVRRCGAVRCLGFHFDIVSSPQTRRGPPSDWSRQGRAGRLS